MNAERPGVFLMATTLIGCDHHDDGRGFSSFEFFKDQESGSLGQHHVQNDDIRFMTAPQSDSFISILRLKCRCAFSCQSQCDSFTDVGVIVDDENRGFCQACSQDSINSVAVPLIITIVEISF